MFGIDFGDIYREPRISTGLCKLSFESVSKQNEESQRMEMLSDRIH